MDTDRAARKSEGGPKSDGSKSEPGWKVASWIFMIAWVTIGTMFPFETPTIIMKTQPLTVLWLAARIVLCGCVVFLAGARVGGQTIWNGPMTTFTEPMNSSGSNPTNQDRITSDVWLTRNMTMGLYNAAEETGYTKDFSPENTEWAYGSLADYASLTYQNWQAWNSSNPPSMVDQPAVVHLISDNIYIGIEFLSWPELGAGGFSYERTTEPVPEPSTALLLAAVGTAALIVYTERRKRLVVRTVVAKPRRLLLEWLPRRRALPAMSPTGQRKGL
jgi:hypothetical protein